MRLFHATMALLHARRARCLMARVNHHALVAEAHFLRAQSYRAGSA